MLSTGRLGGAGKACKTCHRVGTGDPFSPGKNKATAEAYGREQGRSMNPYDANLSNVSSRLLAWVRGLTRQYRRPLLILLAATATFAVGVNAGPTPAPVTVTAR
jgi:hypothetical protein